jgi:hypothetical protein
MEAKLDSNQEEIKASMEEIRAEMKVWRGEIKAWLEPGRAENRIFQEKKETCLERKEPTPEDMVKVAAHPEDSKWCATRWSGQMRTDPSIGIRP